MFLGRLVFLLAKETSPESAAASPSFCAVFWTAAGSVTDVATSDMLKERNEAAKTESDRRPMKEQFGANPVETTNRNDSGCDKYKS